MRGLTDVSTPPAKSHCRFIYNVQQGSLNFLCPPPVWVRPGPRDVPCVQQSSVCVPIAIALEGVEANSSDRPVLMGREGGEKWK